MVMGDMTMKVDVVVIGSGPGGYSAAFRAADLGLDVTLVDSREKPGGSNLYEGCIPSKIYLHQAQLLLDTPNAHTMGIHFPKATINLQQLRAGKDQIVDSLANNLHQLSTQRGIQVIQGKVFFENATTLRLKDSEIAQLQFKHVIIATGSVPLIFPGTTPSTDSKIIYSTGALNPRVIPEKLLIIGGGYTGLELGTIYAAFGSTVHLAEKQQDLLPGVDKDLSQPLKRKLPELFARIMVHTTVNKITEHKDSVQVELQTPEGVTTESYDRVLVTIGRRPASAELGLENTGVKRNEDGFIQTNPQQQTTAANIFAVGDVTNGIMLTHTAIREGRIAAEVIAGLPAAYDVRAVPNILYTSPQIAWCGLTEREAVEQHIPVIILKHPWKYSARAKIIGSTAGLTKVIVSQADGRILGAGICGRRAEELISEWVLAIELGALAEDIELCLHGYPTLAEASGDAAEMFSCPAKVSIQQTTHSEGANK